MEKLYFWGWGLAILGIMTATTAAPQPQRLQSVRQNFDSEEPTAPTAQEQLNSSTSTSSSTTETLSSSVTPTTQTTTTNYYITSKPPLSSPDIDRINNGVTTILNGVMTLDLAQILRGAFIFPKSDKVKNVANNVIDTIFGPAPVTGPISSNGNYSSQTRNFFKQRV